MSEKVNKHKNAWFGVMVDYIGQILIAFIIPHVNFQQSNWSTGRMTIFNVTRQCLTAVKFVVEMGHSV